MGTLRPHARTSRRRTILRAEGAAAARRHEGAHSSRRPRPTRYSRSAPASGCACIPRTGIKTPYTSWNFDATTTRMPEFTAPGLGRESNQVSDRGRVRRQCFGRALRARRRQRRPTLYMDEGQLVYEYNMMIIERYEARSAGQDAAGKHRIEVDTTIARATAPARRGRAQGGWRRKSPERPSSGPFRRRSPPARLRCRRRPRLAGVARLLRPAAVPVRRQDRQGRG